MDQRPGVIEDEDSSIRIGAHQGQPSTDPGMGPPGAPPSGMPSEGAPPGAGGGGVSNEAGPAEDMFAVFNGNVDDPTDGVPAWRYIARDCLSTPKSRRLKNSAKPSRTRKNPKRIRSPEECFARLGSPNFRVALVSLNERPPGAQAFALKSPSVDFECKRRCYDS
jgi:hypothetical protein